MYDISLNTLTALHVAQTTVQTPDQTVPGQVFAPVATLIVNITLRVKQLDHIRCTNI